jgi:hypothetical protein
MDVLGEASAGDVREAANVEAWNSCESAGIDLSVNFHKLKSLIKRSKSNGGMLLLHETLWHWA